MFQTRVGYMLIDSDPVHVHWAAGIHTCVPEWLFRIETNMPTCWYLDGLHLMLFVTEFRSSRRERATVDTLDNATFFNMGTTCSHFWCNLKHIARFGRL